MATPGKLRELTSSPSQQIGGGIRIRPAAFECCRLLSNRWGGPQKKWSWSCKIEQDAGNAIRNFRQGTRTFSLERSFKRAALPLDRASIEGETDTEKQEDEEPWLGAVVFKRSSTQTHYEFQTSLERLGLAVLSSDASSSLANSIGIVSKTPASGAGQDNVTPVGISIDVSREGRDLRLDGLVRTAITLCCNRCLCPVVERVFADFSLLLTEKEVKEPTQQRIGVVIGDNPYHAPDDDGDGLDLDLDDKLQFPRDHKEMDLSKYLRDTVHLEIPSKSLCSADCSGLCLSCGVNLNQSTCKCVDVKVKPSWGPLEQLKRQLEEEEKEGDDDILEL
ncbi:DUF177 domain-containing protein [Marchantia polymorpha subsp. ruderalis]|uniref:Large ribosomal RNA subunit accumulation protein YceD n=2 Tax=Marchantia polymorpha TaxID=3197 RepID=A0A176WKG1_MARPO|nr:hypothetical protein AXG93_4689s1470 [Marchantia polymorpha subsp. ruderalis]PTQ49814.1 hypothetical protein MARPO_0002s0264 [Marchantia polymorpha]BBN00070.1 hypothetical protein Mp_1g26130 [Marchantia polymorpha subsp. ruderalis]|eukprot:PTQ49814.1 hypothetical protein MARPO_0002s0264 [Marchantia polymorpha]